ncbi:hypothetical protein SDC9_139341 [bioreactor metagenome]|uniref:Uncharacterized protein n=1 Tax=bioreactor metagenome TaxID=1076179 RepID=A0A645DS99_9ZZZZ
MQICTTSGFSSSSICRKSSYPRITPYASAVCCAFSRVQTAQTSTLPMRRSASICAAPTNPIPTIQVRNRSIVTCLQTASYREIVFCLHYNGYHAGIQGARNVASDSRFLTQFVPLIQENVIKQQTQVICYTATSRNLINIIRNG